MKNIVQEREREREKESLKLYNQLSHSKCARNRRKKKENKIIAEAKQNNPCGLFSYFDFFSFLLFTFCSLQFYSIVWSIKSSLSLSLSASCSSPRGSKLPGTKKDSKYKYGTDYDNIKPFAYSKRAEMCRLILDHIRVVSQV